MDKIEKFNEKVENLKRNKPFSDTKTSLGILRHTPKFLIISLFLLFLILPMVSSFEFDNRIDVKDTIGKAGYPDVEIGNFFGLGAPLWNGTLDYNTNKCLINCVAEQTIILYEEGSLVDEIIFEKKVDNDWIETQIEYQIYIQNGTKENNISDYEEVCGKEVDVNGTLTNCKTELVGSHLEYEPIWEEYKLGTKMSAGKYVVKLEGTKDREDSIDWIYKTQGETIGAWAEWTPSFNEGLIGYWFMDEDSGTNVEDEIFSNNGTIANVGNSEWVEFYNTGGLTCGNATASGAYVNISNIPAYNDLSTTTVCYNMRVDYTQDFTLVAGQLTAVWDQDTWTLYLSNNPDTTAHVFGDANNNGVPNTVGKAQSYCTRYNEGTGIIETFIDGVNVQNKTGGGAIPNREDNIYFCGGAGVVGNSRITLNQFAYWNRSLTTEEILDIQNFNLTYVPTAPPVPPEVHIVYPTNDTGYSNNLLSVNYTYNSTIVDSCWYSNDTWAVNTSLTDCGTNITDVTWSEGEHVVTVWINDTVGNLNESSVTFDIDSIIPDIEIVYPINYNNYTNTELSVNYTYYDLNVDSCWYSNDSYTENITIACGTNITDVTWSEGQHNFTIWINDSVNNINSSDIAFGIDTLNPEIEIIYPTNNTNSTNNLLSINYTYLEATPNTCWYSNDTYTENITIDCNTNITDVTWIDGSHLLTIWINDSSNNINESSVNFMIDTITPDIEIVQPGNETNYSDYGLVVNYTYYDLNVDSCWWNDDEGAGTNMTISCGSNVSGLWVEGINTVNIWINDTSNNVNESSVTFTIDNNNPNIEIVYPNNNTNSTNNLLSINYTYSDTTTDTCWYSNDTWIENTTITCGTNITDLTWSEGQHDLTLWINDSLNRINQSSVSFFIDTITPNIDIVYPINHTNQTSNTVSINYTYIETNPDTCWYSNDSWDLNTTLTNCGTNITDIIWTQGEHVVTIWINDSLNNINESSVTFLVDSNTPEITINYPANDTSYTTNAVNINYSYIETNPDTCWYSNDTWAVNTTLTNCNTNITEVLWSDGEHVVTIWINDSLNSVNETSVTFSIDATIPLIDIVFPTNLSNSTNTDLSINYTYFETNPNTCWYSNDTWTVNTTITCGENITNVKWSEGEHVVTIWINDSYNNVNETSVTFNRTSINEDNVSYTNPTFEGNTEAFDINITLPPGEALTTSTLWYNGTPYTSTVTNWNGFYGSYNNFDIPLTDALLNVSFFWEFKTTSTSINSSIYEHEVNRIYLSLCDDTYDVGYVNFTTRSATNPFPVINATFKSTWDIWLGSGNVKRNYTYEDTNENVTQFDFCVSPSDKNYTIDATIEFDATGYAQNYHYLANATISNTTNEINLSLLNDSAATLTVLRVQDGSQNPVPDIYIQVQLYDVGTDTYYTVSMAKTADNGEDLVYLNWYDSLYRFILFQNGTVIYTTTPYKISGTPQVFQISEIISFDYKKFDDINYQLYYNNDTQNFVLIFSNPTGLSIEGCLRVLKSEATNLTTICDSCETSSSATLYCNIADYGNGTYYATFYAIGSYEEIWHIVEVIGEVIGVANDIYDLIGKVDGTIYAFLFAGIVLAMLFINPIFGVIGVMLGVIGAMLLGFQPLIDYVIIVVIGFFIIWLIKR